ncbi:MAG TPA: DUF6782 family putative metallopeptidase [Solirubrobacteraceae bacterium]|nr:DUF6782 family putative metallopeptidase [Solirubrobacteraceae bacterium]
MRAKYNIAAACVLSAIAALADPCPPALTGVAAAVAQLRHVAGTFSPPCRVVSVEALRGELERKLRRDLPIAPQLYLEALVRTGFVDGEPADLYRHLLGFYTSQVLGFYEPARDEMVIVNSPAASSGESSAVWAHELEHAVQEHRFHLPSRLLAMRTDSDAQRAASAIAEGEAMLVMLIVNGGGGASASSLDAQDVALAQQAATLTAPGVPDFFIQDLVFPYATGLATVLRAYEAGSWPAVDRLLAHPPADTAALLHPSEAHRAPVVSAGALPAVPPGWDEVLTDVVGEWGLSFLLGRRLPHAEASGIAAGWDGDRLRLIRETAHPQRWALVWRIACRDDGKRQALEEALRHHFPILLARLSDPGPPRLDWAATDRSLEVRAAWPAAAPR